MPRRKLSSIEKEIFAADSKIRSYDAELKEVGAEIGGHMERRRTSEAAINRLEKELKQRRRDLDTAKTRLRNSKQRAAHLRDLKRKRKTVLRNQAYREQANPIRKELGLKPL